MTFWQVRCKERPCKVEHPCYTADSFISFATEAEAIEAWNTRAEIHTQHTHCCPCGAQRTCYAIPSVTQDMIHTHVCSECGGEMYGVMNYCPSCGAKVVE